MSSPCVVVLKHVCDEREANKIQSLQKYVNSEKYVIFVNILACSYDNDLYG